MSKFLLPALPLLLTAGRCAKYDGSALQAIVEALQANDYVTGVDSFSVPQLRINPATNKWEVCTIGSGAGESGWTSTGVEANCHFAT